MAYCKNDIRIISFEDGQKYHRYCQSDYINERGGNDKRKKRNNLFEIKDTVISEQELYLASSNLFVFHCNNNERGK